MKKFLAGMLAALGLLIAPQTSAQESDTAPMWGIRAAFDVNIPGNWRGGGNSVKMYREGYGVTVGAVYNVYLGRNFYFEPGASFFYDSYSYDDLHILDSNGNIADSNPKIHKFGLRVPLLAGYTFSVGRGYYLSVNTGPELNYSLGGEISYRHTDALGEDFPTDLFGIHGQRRFDCAWRVGIGAPISAFFVSIDAAIGILDQLRGDMHFRENRVSVSATYYF